MGVREALAELPAPNLRHQCAACRGGIIWGRTRHGRWIALNPEPDADGHLVLLDDQRIYEIPIAVLAAATPVERAASPTAPYRHRPHSTTCGVGPGVSALGDSINRWLRGDTRRSRRAGRCSPSVSVTSSTDRPLATCDDCGASIVWGRSVVDSAGWLPLDAVPNALGLLVFVDERDPTNFDVEPIALGAGGRSGRRRYRNHHLSCR